MISVEEARSRVLAPLCSMPPETVGLGEGSGRVLAHDVVARHTQPPADMSAMDGYAIRAADAGVDVTLAIAGRAPAGHPFAGVVEPGQAVRLFTGSVVPSHANAVVLQEHVERRGESILLQGGALPGQHIRRRGQDFTAGQVVLRAGRRLDARAVGLAAAAGHPWLTVHRRPTVAILATGDEIAMPGEPTAEGGIVSSNSHMLAAMVREAGGIPIVLPIARDTPDAIGAAAGQALGADLLLTTGGASVGDHDLVQAGLARHGFALDFWKIAMRPGKPMISGRIGTTPVIGLPGNPVSAFVCAVLFLLPALARLSGLPGDAPATDEAALGAPIAANDQRADHLRATLSRNAAGGLIATPQARQDSSLLSVLAQAGCLVLRAPHAPALTVGDRVRIIRLSQGSGSDDQFNFRDEGMLTK